MKTKTTNKNIDTLQSDFSWLDEITEISEFEIQEKDIVKSKSNRGQMTKLIEIGGQILTVKRVPSSNSIAGGKKISKKMKGVPKSESHREAISAAKRGKPNGRKGIPLSEIHKKHIGDSNRGVSRKTAWQGRKHRADSIEKIRQHNLNRDAYVYTDVQKAQISKSISAGKKGKQRSPEMLEQMAKQRAMNFRAPIGIFRDRSKAEKAYFELGYSKQDFKKLYMHQPKSFYYTNAAVGA